MSVTEYQCLKEICLSSVKYILIQIASDKLKVEVGLQKLESKERILKWC